MISISLYFKSYVPNQSKRHSPFYFSNRSSNICD